MAPNELMKAIGARAESTLWDRDGANQILRRRRFFNFFERYLHASKVLNVIVVVDVKVIQKVGLDPRFAVFLGGV